MNIYDVSEKAGVSIATVSRVVNGNENVSEKTRQKVLQVMEELNYTPNVFARGLGTNTMHTIGILCADASDAYQANAVYYLEQALQEYHYNCFLCCTGYQHETKEKYMQLLLAKRVDAIILIGSTYVESQEENQKYLLDAAKNVPVFLINAYIDATGIYSIYCDDTGAACDATNLLIHNGCRNIAFIYDVHSFSCKRKRQGYLQALKQQNIAVREELLIEAPHSIQGTRDLLAQKYAEGLRFDGVMAVEDYLAVGTLKFANQQGIKVPEQLGIVGYNDSILAQCCEPELTTVDNKIAYLCHMTVHTLMRVLDKQEVDAKTCVDCAVIRRGTTP